MGCLGVLFAIDKEQVQKLRNCRDDDELVQYIQEDIEKEWDEDWLCETDKAWDAIHRCFADGHLDLSGGSSPLNSVIFGGEILNKGDNYYVSLKNNNIVKQIGMEIANIDKETLRRLYENISDDYQGEKSEEDFQYTWDWFEGVKEFYIEVADTDRSVIFTVDQ